MPVVVFIVLGVLIFIIAMLGFVGHIIDYRREVGRKKLKGCLCEYSVTGGMENEYHIIRVTYDSGDEADLTEEKCVDESEKIVKKTMKVPFEAIYRLFEVFDDYDIEKWGKLEDADELLLDAPTRMLTFRTGDEDYSFTSDQKLPKSDVFSRITTILYYYIENTEQ